MVGQGVVWRGMVRTGGAGFVRLGQAKLAKATDSLFHRQIVADSW